jgi:hypothetical protein
MRILFDQGAPVPIAAYLREHIVRTALEEGWDTLANGELLRLAEEAGFDVLLTADNNLAYQQNLKGRKIAIVVLSGNAESDSPSAFHEFNRFLIHPNSYTARTKVTGPCHFLPVSSLPYESGAVVASERVLP